MRNGARHKERLNGKRKAAAGTTQRGSSRAARQTVRAVALHSERRGSQHRARARADSDARLGDAESSLPTPGLPPSSRATSGPRLPAAKLALIARWWRRLTSRRLRERPVFGYGSPRVSWDGIDMAGSKRRFLRAVEQSAAFRRARARARPDPEGPLYPVRFYAKEDTEPEAASAL